MIVNERVVAYINSLDCGNSDICNTIEKEAIADEVPIIRKEMGNLLKVLLQLVQPERILEVGTAVGYSSILMSENMPEKCTITTIENYDKRIPVARNNFKMILLVEPLEHIGQRLRADALPGVPDGDLGFGAKLFHAEADGAARRGELDGVVQQIIRHLMDQVRVGVDQHLFVKASRIYHK